MINLLDNVYINQIIFNKCKFYSLKVESLQLIFKIKQKFLFSQIQCCCQVLLQAWDFGLQRGTDGIYLI